MSIRTATTTTVFARPFRLQGYDGVFAAGAYTVETDEQLLDGLSFSSYLRIRTAIHLHRTACQPGEGRVVVIPGVALDEAIALDRTPGDDSLKI